MFSYWRTHLTQISFRIAAKFARKPASRRKTSYRRCSTWTWSITTRASTSSCSLMTWSRDTSARWRSGKCESSFAACTGRRKTGASGASGDRLIWQNLFGKPRRRRRAVRASRHSSTAASLICGVSRVATAANACFYRCSQQQSWHIDGMTQSPAAPTSLSSSEVASNFGARCAKLLTSMTGSYSLLAFVPELRVFLLLLESLQRVFPP